MSVIITSKNQDKVFWGNRHTRTVNEDEEGSSIPVRNLEWLFEAD